MRLSKKKLLAYLLYLIATIAIFLNVNASEIKNKHLFFFFENSDIKYKIDVALALDPNTGSVLISRLFHNKVFFSLDTFTNSIYEATDPVFLFSLSDKAPLYSDPNNVKMLFPLELPLFIISIIYIARIWNFKRDKYLYLLAFFLLSLFITGLILPPLYPLKLLPLVLAIRTTILFGFADWVGNQKWAKKYFS